MASVLVDRWGSFRAGSWPLFLLVLLGRVARHTSSLMRVVVVPGNPPELGNLVDAKTVEALVWRGGSFSEGR